jgi:hypothetical protein
MIMNDCCSLVEFFSLVQMQNKAPNKLLQKAMHNLTGLFPVKNKQEVQVL